MLLKTVQRKVSISTLLMSNKFKVSALVVLLVLSLAPRVAGADTSLRFKTPAVCKTEGGSIVNIDPGRYLPEPVWMDLDTDYKVMETRLTRLEAENKSLRQSDKGVSWGWSVAGLAAGTLATVLADHYLRD